MPSPHIIQDKITVNHEIRVRLSNSSDFSPLMITLVLGMHQIPSSELLIYFPLPFFAGYLVPDFLRGTETHHHTGLQA